MYIQNVPVCTSTTRTCVEQQHRLEILQKWIEADQELDAAHAKQVQTKHEMSILVAEQTAENAKAVNQGTSGIQSLSSPSNPDSDAQQTILSVFKSVLSMQNMGCHSVAEQLMAAGATDEEVKKISQIMAQTVRKLEGGSNIPEPGIEMPKPACEVVVLDAELSKCTPGYSSMDIEGPEAIKRRVSNAATEKRRLAKKCKQEEDVLLPDLSLVLDSVHRSTFSISRFPELAKRRIQVLFALQRSCLAPITMQLAYGLRICPTGAKWNWNHCSHKLVNADKCLVNVSEKIPSSTHHRSVRTSTALTVIWIEVPCLFPLNVTKTLHTLNNFVIISLFFKKVSRVAVVIMFCRICIFVAWKARSGVTPFVIARPEDDANTLGRDASWSFPKVW